MLSVCHFSWESYNQVNHGSDLLLKIKRCILNMSPKNIQYSTLNFQFSTIFLIEDLYQKDTPLFAPH